MKMKAEWRARTSLPMLIHHGRWMGWMQGAFQGKPLPHLWLATSLFGSGERAATPATLCVVDEVQGEAAVCPLDQTQKCQSWRWALKATDADRSWNEPCGRDLGGLQKGACASNPTPTSRWGGDDTMRQPGGGTTGAWTCVRYAL